MLFEYIVAGVVSDTTTPTPAATPASAILHDVPRLDQRCDQPVTSRVESPHLEPFRSAIALYCERLERGRTHEAYRLDSPPEKKELKFWMESCSVIGERLASPGGLLTADAPIDIILLLYSFGHLMRTDHQPPLCICCLRPERKIIKSHFWPRSLLVLCSSQWYQSGTLQRSNEFVVGNGALAWKAFCKDRSLTSDLQGLKPCEDLFGESEGGAFIRRLLQRLGQEPAHHDATCAGTLVDGDQHHVIYGSDVFRMIMSIALRIIVGHFGEDDPSVLVPILSRFLEAGCTCTSVLRAELADRLVPIAKLFIRLRQFVVADHISADFDGHGLRLYMISSARAHGRMCKDEQPIGHQLQTALCGSTHVPFVHLWIRGLHFIATTNEFPRAWFCDDWIRRMSPAGGHLDIRAMSTAVLRTEALVKYVRRNNSLRLLKLSTCNGARSTDEAPNDTGRVLNHRLDQDFIALPYGFTFNAGKRFDSDLVTGSCIYQLCRVYDGICSRHTTLAGSLFRSWLFKNVRSKKVGYVIIIRLVAEGGSSNSFRVVTAWQFARTESGNGAIDESTIMPPAEIHYSLSIPLSDWNAIVLTSFRDFTSASDRSF